MDRDSGSAVKPCTGPSPSSADDDRIHAPHAMTKKGLEQPSEATRRWSGKESTRNCFALMAATLMNRKRLLIGGAGSAIDSICSSATVSSATLTGRRSAADISVYSGNCCPALKAVTFLVADPQDLDASPFASPISGGRHERSVCVYVRDPSRGQCCHSAADPIVEMTAGSTETTF